MKNATEALLRMRNLLVTKTLFPELKNHSLLETRVQERTGELEQSQLEILERLARVAEIRDDETGRHTQRVADMAAGIARHLGINNRAVDVLQRAAPLHDIGKVGIPDRILLKPGALTTEEHQVMQTHTVIGARILTGGRSEIMMMAELIALSHHERWDGSGYPHGLSGSEIPVEARIVAVADCVDALTHNRPYRAALPLGRVITELRRSSGSHFDPEIVDALLDGAWQRTIPVSPARPAPAIPARIA